MLLKGVTEIMDGCPLLTPKRTLIDQMSKKYHAPSLDDMFLYHHVNFGIHRIYGRVRKLSQLKHEY